MKRVLGLVLVLALAGCGRQATVSQEAAFPATTASCAATCPLSFPKAGLCASVTWKKGPGADAENALEVRFWQSGVGDPVAGPFVDPAEAPKAFFIMKCCKTPTACPLTKTATGVYSASMIKLVPGEFWHRVMLGKETISTDVTVK